MNGFSGEGITIACIINSSYDFIIGSGHMTNSTNTVMRCSIKNTYTSQQTVFISAIRLFI